MLWYAFSFILKPIKLLNGFLKNGSWYFVYWDKKANILELELFGKHIFYLYIK
jgi:hypothetical protein